MSLQGRIGLDSYSYHRRYGEIRIGEDRCDPDTTWAATPQHVIAECISLGIEKVFLETCYLPAPSEIDASDLSPGEIDTAFSWGHPWPGSAPHGLHGGRSPAAEADLRRWIDAAKRVGHTVMRITAGNADVRAGNPHESFVSALAPALRRAAEYAESCDIMLALENHGDLRASELLDLLTEVDSNALGVCLDNVNLVRVGDDMVDGAKMLAPHTLVVHLKDCSAGDPGVAGGPVSVPYGTGVADLTGVLTALDSYDFTGPICVELGSLGPGDVDEHQIVEQSVTWLRAELLKY
jgi:sugar phosphate isomerase/epimerase